MEVNLRHLVNVSVRSNPEPFPEDKLRLAFGSWGAPKLVREIGGSSLVIKQKALVEVLKQIAAPKVLGTLLVAGLVPALNTAATDSDDVVRASATASLAQVTPSTAAAHSTLLCYTRILPFYLF